MDFLDALFRDVQYGLRMLRKTPLISIAVVLTLAVGIGLDTGVFAVINGLLLRPRTDSDPATFVRLYADYTERGAPREYFGEWTPAAYSQLLASSRVLANVAAWRSDGVLLGDDAQRSLALEVSCEFFSVYGLGQPLAGRLFRPDECGAATESSVVVISEELWRTRFGADPQILGRSILLNRQPFTVIGIAPKNFSGRLRGPGIWAPLSVQARLTGDDNIFLHPDTPSFWVEGRLRPGRSRTELASELNVIAAHFSAAGQERKNTVDVTNGSMIADPAIRSVAYWIILLILSGLTLLLVVSCATAAVLLLSRAAARRREIAVRISLGASRLRIFRQLLAENLLLALAAGAGSIYLALQVPKAFQRLFARLPYYPFDLDWHIFGYLAGVTLLASLLAGLAPAVECLKQDVWISLKGTETSLSVGRSRWSLRDLLVIVQVSFSVVLMVASAMFIHVELAIMGADPGFDTKNILQVPVELPVDRYDAARGREFYRTLQQHLAENSQIETIASTSQSPLESAAAQDAEFRLPQQTRSQVHGVTQRYVSSNYFEALAIPFLRGQPFTHSAADANSAIVSQAFAAAFWPGRDPVGEVILARGDIPLRVIGVVPDTRTQNPERPDDPAIYRLRDQAESGDLLLLRFRGSADAVELTVKNAVQAVDPQVFVLSSTLRAALDDLAEAFWRLGQLLLFVALVAAALALLGIYGVVGYSVTRRTREFGIRSALGASRRRISYLVLSSGMKPVLAGTVLGIMLSVIAGLSIVAVLKAAPLTPSIRDPLTYASVCFLLTTSALAAMLHHARRAARIEPLVALREE